jgi:hypothetical protein
MRVSLSLYPIICQLSLYSSLCLFLGPHFARLLLAGLGRQGTVDDAAAQRRLQLDVALQLVDPPGVCVRACERARGCLGVSARACVRECVSALVCV